MHPRTRSNSLQWASLFFLFVLAALNGSRAAWAQADPTASLSTAFSAFGGYTSSNPDYGPNRNNGATVGVDYTHYFGWRLTPSFEARGNYTTGTVLKQGSILFGLRLQAGVRRFHPYADALYGVTKIVYKNPPFPSYTYDIGGTTSIGGGVDVDLTPALQAKFDFQSEFMNFGPNGIVPNNADFTLTPTLLTVGVVYHLPVHGRHKH